LTKGRIAAVNGQFNRIHQVAPMCPPMRAHTTWRIRLHLCFLGPTGVCNPNGKFLENPRGKSQPCLGMSFPLIIGPSHGGYQPRLIHASTFHALTGVHNSNGISIGSAVFGQSILYNGIPFPS